MRYYFYIILSCISELLCTTYFSVCVFCILVLYFSVIQFFLWWSIWARDIKSPRRWVTLSCLPRNSYNLEYIWQGQNRKDEYFFCFLLLSHVALLESFNALLLHFFDFTNTWPVYTVSAFFVYYSNLPWHKKV